MMRVTTYCALLCSAKCHYEKATEGNWFQCLSYTTVQKVLVHLDKRMMASTLFLCIGEQLL